MKIIFALGNPGANYSSTRHNVGFMVVDDVACQQGIDFMPKSKFSAEIAEFSTDGEKILLVKPTTYYNEVGVAAQALLDFYKVSLAHILVVHDDTALDFGKIRLRRGGESAGNNGLKSLHRHIGQDFWHIRIGTDSLLRRQIGDTDFVLGKFNSDETTILKDWVMPTTMSIVDSFLKGTLEATSYRLQ